MADPLSIAPRNIFFVCVRLKSVILIEEDFLSITVELSRYSKIRFEVTSVMISSFKYMVSYKFNDLVSFLSFIA